MLDRTVKRTDYGPFARWFGRTVMRSLGWKWTGQRPDVSKCVIACAPHTTNWDLFFTLLAAMALRFPMVFMMKKFWFFWPMGPVFRWLGGIPVDRSKNTNAVEQMVQAFQENAQLNLVITPEGTRKDVRYWKTGFYWIAAGAGVPILLGIINYKKKEAGVGILVYPTGNLEADFEIIRDFYEREAGMTPRLRPPDERERQRTQ